jgi:Rod binding domain-containing protein
MTMGNAVIAIFKQPLTGAGRKPDANQAAQGFSALFASMLASEMRKALVGDGKGPLGIGGASGSIYGALFDQAIGKTLAHSPAMKPLNALLLRQLGGAGQAGKTAGKGTAATGKLLRASVRTCGSCETTAAGSGASATPVSDLAPANSLPSDSRGPVLLPPPPSSLAPILPPPSPLES